MLIGVPREIKIGETRVSMTPSLCRRVTALAEIVPSTWTLSAVTTTTPPVLPFHGLAARVAPAGTVRF